MPSAWQRIAAVGIALASAAAIAMVDVNLANRAQLEAVRGVGTELAERILIARQQGPFEDWADLIARVPGLGPASAARLSAAGLTVGGQTYPADRR
jgi:competence protein ComEA